MKILNKSTDDSKYILFKVSHDHDEETFEKNKYKYD